MRDDIDPLSVRHDARMDVTVISTLAESYVAAAAQEAGEVAEQAAARKCAKHAELPST